jgi:hypothetical protein
MRAKEFLTEQQLSDVHDALDVAALSLPNTYMMPEINNSNFYDIYRFGLAVAAVRGESGNDNVYAHKTPEFRAQSKWGPNLIISSFDPDVKQVIQQALKKVNKKGIKTVSSQGSDEMLDTNKGSPVKGFKGYPK